MKTFFYGIKKQWTSFKKHENDLVQLTATAQIKAYPFIALLIALCAIADYTVLSQSPIGIKTGFKIKLFLILYCFLIPIIMKIMYKYKKKLVIYVAYLNISVGLFTVLFGPLYPDFSLSLAELFSLILIPSFTVFGPNMIYQIIIFTIIAIDLGLELYYSNVDHLLIHMMYYSFDSICLYGLVAFANNIIVKNKIKELDVRYELQKVSETDSLTGLLNRRAILEEIKKYQKTEGNFGMLVVDLDDFKEVNDTYGHLAGDRILNDMGDALTLTFQDMGILSRFGGDEFMAFFPLTEEKILQERLDLLKSNFDTINTEFKGKTYSYGYAILKNEMESDLFHALFTVADKKMYEQKALKNET